MDLQSFAEEARSEGAIVLNSVQAEIGDDGLLQSFLEDADVQVAHTGSDALASKLCHDKVRSHVRIHPTSVPAFTPCSDQL